MCSDVVKLTGKIVTPCQKEYELARQEWNRAIQKFPCIIIYCFTIQDIKNAVCWSRQHDVPIRIRSGGHHYQGYSTGDKVMVIDVSPMKKISLDEVNQTVAIQCGVSNREVYAYLGEEGYPFPGGTCPTVGVTGYTLGGGWGYLSRYMGLGCDSLTELEMVNAQGNVLTANERNNPDLFWACRGGGGGNFGIVTSMVFKLPPKIPGVTLVELECSDASSGDMVQFLQIWQEWLDGLDYRITVNASLYHSQIEGMGIYGRGLFCGSAKEAEQILQPFKIINGLNVHLQELTFYEAIKRIQETYPASEKFQSTGRFVKRHYHIDELRNIVNLICKRAEGSVYAAISVYALGGKIGQINRKDSAYYYRDAAYIMGIHTVWENNDNASTNREWLYDRFQYLKEITDGSYINFPYNCLRNYEKAYYGDHVCRLRQVNQEYDPFHVFSFPQAIQ